MIFSGLCLSLPHIGHTQERLFPAFAAETYAEIPVLSCFIPSFAGLRFRNDFGTKEMMHAELFGTYTIHRNHLTASIAHYGYSEYGNATIAAGYGRDFGGRFALSGRIFYIMEHARGYPMRHSLCADAGFAFNISQKVTLFTDIYNPFMMRYGIVGQDIIPLKFTIGCLYSPTPKLLLSAMTTKAVPGGWEVGARFITQPISPLLLAAEGTNTHLGLTIYLIHKQFLFSVKAAWHYRISVSPEVGGYYFKQ